MTKTVNFQIYVKVWPFDGFRSTHLNVEYAFNGGIAHPWHTVI